MLTLRISFSHSEVESDCLVLSRTLRKVWLDNSEGITKWRNYEHVEFG